MKQKCVLSGLVLGTLLIAYEGNSWANGEYRGPGDMRASNQEPKRATPSLFSNVLEMILAIRQSEPVPVEPQLCHADGRVCVPSGRWCRRQ